MKEKRIEELMRELEGVKSAINALTGEYPEVFEAYQDLIREYNDAVHRVEEHLRGEVALTMQKKCAVFGPFEVKRCSHYKVSLKELLRVHGKVFRDTPEVVKSVDVQALLAIDPLFFDKNPEVVSEVNGKALLAICDAGKAPAGTRSAITEEFTVAVTKPPSLTTSMK